MLAMTHDVTIRSMAQDAQEYMARVHQIDHGAPESSDAKDGA